MRRLGVIVVLVLILAAGPRASGGTESVGPVYALDVYDGQTYVPAFVPPTAATMFLMADVPHVVVARRTRIYYWPLMSRYLPDWETRNELVMGTLEIEPDGTRGPARRLERTAYAFSIPSGESKRRVLLQGQAAQRATEAFQASIEAYRRMLRSPNSGAGTAPPTLPDAVLEPLGQGFVVSLPPGDYRIRLLGNDGREIPGTSRALVAFAPRRTGVGYTIIPESRWTSPLTSLRPDDVLYHDGREVIYLQPLQTFEVREGAYRRMLDPQDESARMERWVWMAGRPYSSQARLTVSAPGRRAEVLTAPYAVVQTPGAALGYSVRPADQAPQRDSGSRFEALRVDLTRETRGQIWLDDGRGGPVPGSRRAFSRVSPSEGPATALALVPLVPALWMIVRQRRRWRWSRHSEQGEGPRNGTEL